MRSTLSRLCAATSAASLMLAVVSTANAYSVTQTSPLNNAPLQPGSTFNAIIDLTGTVNATGGGAAFDSKANKGKGGITPFVLTAPTTHPLSLYGGATTVDHYDSDGNIDYNGAKPTDGPGGPATWTLDESNLHQLTNVSSLDVDLLNGSEGPFALDTIHLLTNSSVGILKDITIDLSGDLTGLGFTQTGGYSNIATGVNTGTFAIDGILNATVSSLGVTALGVISVPVEDQALSLPGALTGTYTVTNIPGGRHISLDGTINLAVPLSLVTQLTTALGTADGSPVALTISTTVDLAASLTVAVGYHLETNIVPEPGSFILLGIGVAALVPLFRRRKK